MDTNDDDKQEMNNLNDNIEDGWGKPTIEDDDSMNPFDDIVSDDFWDSVVEDDKGIPIERLDEISKAREAYEKVDNQIIDFIENFVDSQKKTLNQKHKLKSIFFWMTMVAFLIVILSPILVILFIKTKNTIPYVAGIIASLIQSLTSIIILPKIVAQYLFNKEEDVATIEIVKLMQTFSEKVHGYNKKE